MPDRYGVRIASDDYTWYNAQDKWGRKYLIQLDIKSRGPCSIQTCFTDPMSTPRQYLNLSPTNPNLLDINYAQWEQDARLAEQDYEGRRAEVSRALYGERAEIDRPPTMELLRIIGKFNGATSAQVHAASEGDHALLGIELPAVQAPVPDVVVPDLSDEAIDVMGTYQEFLKHFRRQGKSIPEAAEAWQAHKALMAEV